MVIAPMGSMMMRAWAVWGLVAVCGACSNPAAGDDAGQGLDAAAARDSGVVCAFGSRTVCGPGDVVPATQYCIAANTYGQCDGVRSDFQWWDVQPDRGFSGDVSRAFLLCEADDGCGPGEQCRLSPFGSAEGARGRLCTRSCVTDQDCAGTTTPGVCVRANGATTGECYQTCVPPNSISCALGLTCTTVGERRICVP